MLFLILLSKNEKLKLISSKIKLIVDFGKVSCIVSIHINCAVSKELFKWIFFNKKKNYKKRLSREVQEKILMLIRINFVTSTVNRIPLIQLNKIKKII